LFAGDLLIIIAQIISAIQFVYEEKFIKKHSFHPLLVVGLEGLLISFIFAVKHARNTSVILVKYRCDFSQLIQKSMDPANSSVLLLNQAQFHFQYCSESHTFVWYAAFY